MVNKPIETDAEYRAALKEVETLLTLIELIEAYEAKHFPLLEEEVEQQRRDEKNELYGPRKAYHLENNDDF